MSLKEPGENNPVMLTVDTETTMNNKIGKNKASPFSPENSVVLLGYTYDDRPDGIIHVNQKHNPRNMGYATHKTISILVGQNLKFDLHHLIKMGYSIQGVPIQKWLQSNPIWDIQIAEYILTGQESQFASLDDMSVKYGLPVKDSKVKDMFEQGIGADKIDRNVLEPYLHQDIKNTKEIAQKQMVEASERGMLPLIMAMMQAAIAIQDIEYNGIKLDLPLLAGEKAKLQAAIFVKEQSLKAMISSLGVTKEEQDALFMHLNLESTHHISAVLFGGGIKYTTKETIKTKTGKDRIRNVERTIIVPRTVSKNYGPQPTKTAGVFKVDEEVLEELSKTRTGTMGRDIAALLLRLRKLYKELGTYYEGLYSLVFEDGLLHPNINQVSTDTGRTSSTEPNGQNIPSSDESNVKRLFISRFGDKGRIVSADYKQLEVVALAYLSRDPQLLEDIRNGTDIHDEVAKSHYGSTVTITKDMRRVIKTINFGLIYGGTARALSVQAGVTKQEAQRAIDAFYKRYPGVREWQDRNYMDVKAVAQDSLKTTKEGLPSKRSVLKSCTGREYVFYEYDNPWRRGDTNFSPTEVKNYSVQGFATGDIVPTMLGVLWKALKNAPELEGRCFIVNMVHDEFVIDCHQDVVDKVCEVVQEVLEDTPKYLKHIYNIDFDLPTRVNITHGPNWKDQDVAYF